MKPRCAKCQRPVDSVEANPDEDADGVEMVFVCHGEQDRVFLTRMQFLMRIGTSESLIPEEVFLGDNTHAKGLGYH